MIVSQSKMSISHKISIVILGIYGAVLLYRFIKNEKKIATRVVDSFKLSGRDYIFFFIVIGLLILDLITNKKLTDEERHDIKNAIKIAVISALTALFAHLDTYVIPGMLALGLSILI